MLYADHQMFILRSFDVTNIKDMNIKLNIKETDITVYDKVNLAYANKDEIVSLIGKVRGDFKTNLIDIFSYSLNLNNSEKELYIIIIDILGNDNTINGIVSIDRAIKACMQVYHKSYITYRRAIDVLIKLYVIRYNNNYTSIVIDESYDVNTITDIAKYIVIEVKDTSRDSQATL